MELPMAKRRYTDEEKRQLLANLDIEGMWVEDLIHYVTH